MKVAKVQKLPLLVLLAFFAVLPATALAANPSRPYFKTFGSDVLTGGWFESSSSCDSSPSSNYQDPSYANASAGINADDRNGGILAYSKGTTDGSGNIHNAGGSSSQFAAFALGQVEGNLANNWGFYSNGAGDSTNPYVNSMTFSNTATSGSSWGGYFDGSVRQSTCIPDYFSKKPANTTPLVAPLPASPSEDSYYATSASNSTFTLTNTDVTIARGTHVTVYINGNAYIGNNITYDLNTTNDIPKFALVVKGNIYIGANVTQLDGVYIAQPSTNTAQAAADDNGDIWTCHENNTNPVLYSFPAFVASCSANKLTINGAIIAKQVNFMRLKGDVGSASTSEDALSNALSSSNIAEVINYTPEMVLGGPFFNPPSQTGLPIDSIISLPPVF